MAVMIGINSIFAAYEIALASVRVARLQEFANEGRPGASTALGMKQNMEASLAVVQLGITLVGATAAAVGGAGAEETLSPAIAAATGLSEGLSDVLAILMVVAPLTFTTIIGGELIPKVFALRNPEWVCLTLSPAMRWFALGVGPAVWLLETIVTGVMSWGEARFGKASADRPKASELQELRANAALARASRLISHLEERMIVGATELLSRPVSAIMLPVEHISTLNVHESPSDHLRHASQDMHTRFPVVERANDPQSIIGFVNVKDIIATMYAAPDNRGDGSIRPVLRHLPSFSEDKSIAACLKRMLQNHSHIALVRDAAGRVAGMVTLEDILEEVVGDIADEFDRLPNHVMPMGGQGWFVGGGISLQNLRQDTGIDLLEGAKPSESLADWMEAALGRKARLGDVLHQDNIRIAIRKLRRHRVREAAITRVPLDEKEA